MDPNKRTRLVSTLGIVAIVVILAVVVIRFIGGIDAGFLGRLSPGRWFSSDTEWSSGGDEDADRTGGRMVALDLPSDLAGFTGITSVGGWKITITQGDYEVGVRVSERSADDVRVDVRDNSLHLGMGPGMRTVTGTLEATVTLPRIDRLETDGGAEVHLDEVEAESFAVDVDGAASITASGGRYGRLVVEVDGAANVDFSGTEVVDANIDMDGASNLSITMAGGTLTGHLRGVGNVSYGGEVASETVRVEGLGRVRAR